MQTTDFTKSAVNTSCHTAPESKRQDRGRNVRQISHLFVCETLPLSAHHKTISGSRATLLLYRRAKVSHFSIDQLYINCITSPLCDSSKLFRPYTCGNQDLNSGKQPLVMNRSTHKRAEETKYSLHLSNDVDFSVWLIFLYQPGNTKLYLLVFNFTLTSKSPVKHFLG